MFKPTPKADFQEKIKQYLMEGNIIRVNGIEDDPLEVISREHVRGLSTMQNIGQLWSEVQLIDKMNCAHSNLYAVVTELKKDYSVKKVHCEYSGCCQYATYGYYLE